MSNAATVTFGVMPNGTNLILKNQDTTAYGNSENQFLLTMVGETPGPDKEIPYWGDAIAPNASSAPGNKVQVDNLTEFVMVNGNGVTHVKAFFANAEGILSTNAFIRSFPRSITAAAYSLTLSGSTQVGGYEAVVDGSTRIDLTVLNATQAQANVPYLGFEVTSGENIGQYNIGNTPDELGVQATAFGFQEPANCFGPQTKIHVMVNTLDRWCSIESLSGKVQVETVTEDGKLEWVWCQVIRESLAKPTSHAYALKDFEPQVWLSRAHFFMVPEGYADERKDLLKPKEEWICISCKKDGVYGYEKGGCKRCAPFKVKDYRGFLAADISKDYSQKNLVDFWGWYHLVPLNPSQSTNGLILENGCLAELYRSSLEKAESRGFVLV